MIYAQEDIFQVKTPNVMIIFDTSSSMDKKPNQADAASSNVCVDSFGRIQAANGGAPPCSPGYTSYHFEGGANHPSSKLYQAKLALKEVIEDIVKDRVNLGFSTYAQFKTEKRRGYYVRDRRDYTNPTSDQWRWQKRYWRFNNYRHSNSIISYSPNSFTDEWGTTHAGVSVGYAFYRPHTFTNSPANNGATVPPMNPVGTDPGTYIANLKYTVTSNSYNAEYNRYTYVYYSDFHDHYEETWRYDYRPNNNPINCDAQFSKNWGPYQTFDSSDPDQIANPAKWACSGPVFIAGVTGGFGPWYQQFAWLEFNNSTTCPAIGQTGNYPVPAPNNVNQYTDYVLVNPAQCYDWSTYDYPANGGNNKPHIWSYFKMAGNDWPWSIQFNRTASTPDLYYPSRDGIGNFNNTPGTMDNHYLFVNFQDDKAPGFTPAIRTANREMITSFLDLTPVQSPETLRYWTKLPVQSIQTNPVNGQPRTGLTSNTTESFFTPLADSLKSAFEYFSDYIFRHNGGDPASQQTSGGVICRGNYIILLTDGLESARCLPSGSCPSGGGGSPDYGAAPIEAANLKTINVKTFVIGFGTDLQGNVTLSSIASSGGTNNAYFASDLPTLKLSLESIFQAILETSYGRSNPTITKSGDRIFKGFFEFTGDQSWKGGLYAYEIDKATGKIVDKDPSTPTVIDPVWDAGEKLTNSGRGTVWTWKDDLLNPPRLLLDKNTASIYDQVYPNPRGEDIDGDGAIDDDDARTIIEYTLDPSFDDRTVGGIHLPGYHKGQRPIIGNKGWKLGDIYHSTPVFIGSPPLGISENGYSIFYQNYRNRTEMVYVGANDGMLHGIKNTKGTASTDGREHIAIIPKRTPLGKVKNLRSNHDYYVDATPKAYDVFLSSLVTSQQWQKWRTVLITGLREGGPYYFATDITNPDGYVFGPEYPRILWEWTDNKMGDSWAKPDVGKINEGGSFKYVAFITGGYSAKSNIGNSFYIIDIETGTTIKSWINLGANDNKIPSGPTAFDVNNDGLVDYIYFGDTKGTLWKVDVRSSDKANWTCNPLFTPPAVAQRKPIFYSPTVVKNNEGKILVFFGTGEELNLLTVTDNYFWEIWDDNGTGRVIGSNWPKVLTGQKVLSSPVVANYVVYFTSWLYTATSEFCGAGSGRLYGLKISNAGLEGGIAGLVLLDSQSKPKSVTEFEVIGPGIPTSPVVTNGTIYVSTNVDAKNVIAIKFLGWPAARTRSWREVF
jgi:hypothetical protein